MKTIVYRPTFKGISEVGLNYIDRCILVGREAIIFEGTTGEVIELCAAKPPRSYYTPSSIRLPQLWIRDNYFDVFERRAEQNMRDKCKKYNIEIRYRNTAPRERL